MRRSVPTGATSGALTRGGDWGAGTDAGIFMISAEQDPSFASAFTGFRCAR
jgi:hypothetical protein